MAKFAIYYIPPADSLLYQRGSAILGYDIRARQTLPVDNPTRQALGEFHSGWVEMSQYYGFHVTTAGTYEYDPMTFAWDAVIETVADILDVLDPHTPLELLASPDLIWGKSFVGLRFTPNQAFQTLHTLLCAMLPQYGILSRPMRKLQQDPQAFGTAHHLAHRTARYFTPYIYDNFVPHFTLLNPFVSANPAPIFEACQMLFGEFSVVEVRSICVVNLSDDAPWYHIVHEFDRGQFPRPYSVTST